MFENQVVYKFLFQFFSTYSQHVRAKKRLRIRFRDSLTFAHPNSVLLEVDRLRCRRCAPLRASLPSAHRRFQTLRRDFAIVAGRCAISGTRWKKENPSTSTARSGARAPLLSLVRFAALCVANRTTSKVRCIRHAYEFEHCTRLFESVSETLCCAT